MPLAHTQLRPVPFDPRRLSGLQLWIDPFWEEGLTRQFAAALRRASSQYLSTADHADLAMSTAFTVEFWKSSFSIGPDRGYLGQYNYAVANGGGWHVSSADSANGGNSIMVYLALNNDGTSIAAGMSPQVSVAAEWSQCVVVYDGTQATNATRLKVYLDGVQQTLTFTGTIPAALQNPTSAFEIGRFAGLGRYIDAAINRVRLWNIALSAPNVTTLFNSGAGLYHASLGALNTSNLKASWDLTESGGTRIDAKNGRNLSENNGPIAWAAIVTQLLDRGAAGLVLSGTFGTGLHWESAGIAGRPALASYGRHFLRALAANWSNAASGDILEMIRFEGLATPLFDHGMLASTDLDTAVRYFFTLVYQNGTNQLIPSLRVRENATPNGTATATSTLALATNYLTNWRGLGSGGAASFTLRLNGVDDPVSLNTPLMHDTWLPTVTGRDVVTLGAFESGGVQGVGTHKMGTKLVFGPLLPPSLNRQAERWLAGQYGIGLP